MYIFKTTEHEMRLSNAKPFNEKMRQELVKIWKKIAIFQHFQLLILKQKKHKPVLLVQKYSTIAKAQQYLHNISKGLQHY